MEMGIRIGTAKEEFIEECKFLFFPGEASEPVEMKEYAAARTSSSWVRRWRRPGPYGPPSTRKRRSSSWPVVRMPPRSAPGNVKVGGVVLCSFLRPNTRPPPPFS